MEEMSPWDPGSGTPPPMTPEYGYVEQSLTPPPLPKWAEGSSQPFDYSQVPPLPPVELPPFDPSLVPPLPEWAQTSAQPFDYPQVPPLPTTEKDPEMSKGEELQGAEAFTEASLLDANEGNENSEEFPSLGILDRDLIQMGRFDPEQMAEFLSAQRALADDVSIDLYHGLNGGLDKALVMLESPDQGVKQISGPCLAVYPIGQFWKPGDAGFKYSIPRGEIEYPGELRPNAKFRVDEGGVVTMVGGLESLPLSKYNGEVIRTEQKRDIIGEKVVDGFIEEEVIGEEIVPLSEGEKENQKQIARRLSEFSQIRALTDALQSTTEAPS